MASRYYYQQELFHKPIKNQPYHLRHVVVLHSYQVLCFFEGEKNQLGFYELWKAKYTQGFIKQDISYVAHMTKPFEYDDESIAFFDSRNTKLYQMQYLKDGILKEIPMSLPTQLFKETLQIELDDEVQEKYLVHCIETKYYRKKKVHIILENLGVFESPTGDICDDSIVSSWCEQGQLGEAIIKKARESLHFDIIDDDNLIIYRQNFFSEGLEFHIWDMKTQAELSIPISIKLEVNICIQRCFQWNQDSFEHKQEFHQMKQEQPMKQQKLMQIAIFANSNGDRHPVAIFVNLNYVMKEVYSFKLQKILLDSKSSMFIEVPWANPEMQDFTAVYYSNDMQLGVVKYNLLNNTKSRIYNHLTDGIPNFSFSQVQGCFVFHTHRKAIEDEPDQNDEIKNQIKMEEPANLTQFFILPTKLILWQYMNRTNLIDIYGDKIMEEVIDVLMKGQSAIIKNESIAKKEIKFEYIL